MLPMIVIMLVGVPALATVGAAALIDAEDPARWTAQLLAAFVVAALLRLTGTSPRAHLAAHHATVCALAGAA